MDNESRCASQSWTGASACNICRIWFDNDQEHFRHMEAHMVCSECLIYHSTRSGPHEGNLHIGPQSSPPTSDDQYDECVLSSKRASTRKEGHILGEAPTEFPEIRETEEMEQQFAFTLAFREGIDGKPSAVIEVRVIDDMEKMKEFVEMVGRETGDRGHWLSKAGSPMPLNNLNLGVPVEPTCYMTEDGEPMAKATEDISLPAMTKDAEPMAEATEDIPLTHESLREPSPIIIEALEETDEPFEEDKPLPFSHSPPSDDVISLYYSSLEESNASEESIPITMQGKINWGTDDENSSDERNFSFSLFSNRGQSQLSTTKIDDVNDEKRKKKMKGKKVKELPTNRSSPLSENLTDHSSLMDIINKAIALPHTGMQFDGVHRDGSPSSSLS